MANNNHNHTYRTSRLRLRTQQQWWKFGKEGRSIIPLESIVCFSIIWGRIGYFLLLVIEALYVLTHRLLSSSTFLLWFTIPKVWTTPLRPWDVTQPSIIRSSPGKTWIYPGIISSSAGYGNCRRMVSSELSLLLLVHLDDINFTHRFPYSAAFTMIAYIPISKLFWYIY